MTTTTLPSASRRRRPLSTATRALWLLEWRRLVRTHRIIALFGVYGFFGATAGPLTRYVGELVERFGAGVQVIVPEPRPVDAFANYVSNANQLGLLVFVMIVSASVTVDATREMAIFIRTRVHHPRDLVLPRYVVNVTAGVAAFAFGVLCTWYGTWLLLGDVDPWRVITGTLLQSVYLAFIASVAAAFGSRLHSTLTTAAATISVALVLAVLGAFDAIGAWLPSRLLSALSAVPAGESASEYVKALGVAIVVSVVLLGVAVRGSAAQEN